MQAMTGKNDLCRRQRQSINDCLNLGSVCGNTLEVEIAVQDEDFIGIFLSRFLSFWTVFTLK